MSSMTAVAEPANLPALPEEARVVGIDTHKHTHHVAVLDHLGRPVADQQFPTTSSGYSQLIDFIRGHGPVDRVGVVGLFIVVLNAFERLDVARFKQRDALL